MSSEYVWTNLFPPLNVNPYSVTLTSSGIGGYM